MKTKLLAASFVAFVMSASAATSEAYYAFSNLWAPQVVSFEEPSSRRVTVQVRACTHSWSNPQNSFRRLRVQLFAPNNNLIRTRTLRFRNTEVTQSFSVRGNFTGSTWKVKLTPMDNARFQGKVRLSSSR